MSIPLLRITLFAVALSGLVSCSLWDKPVQSASLYGQVWGNPPCGRALSPTESEKRNCEARPLQVDIIVTRNDDAWSQTLKTDDQGRYRLNLTPGRYTVKALPQGNYHGAEYDVELSPGQELQRLFKLISKAR